MLMIRLARRGKKNSPFFRVIISEKGRDTLGKSLEILGYYNPVSKVKDLRFDKERILYWISKGAQVSPTVKNLLIEEKIIEGEKIKKKTGKKKEKK